MTTLTLSKRSPTNNTLTHSDGTVYEVSTPFRFGSRTTTCRKNGQVLATIKWPTSGKNEVTMGGMTAPLSDVFPGDGNLSTSRLFTTASGEKLKWIDKSKLQCVPVDSDIPFATYDYKHFASIRGKKSTLDISPNASHLTDVLVVTWVIAEKKAQEARRTAASSGGASVSTAASGDAKES
ncbi:hypothetical protein B0J17DRAFT_162307 [Rhizoctonia solani]|nr:hypothetical protein B0J17DRAFT_162307 [Rhizoctonia solani]